MKNLVPILVMLLVGGCAGSAPVDDSAAEDAAVIHGSPQLSNTGLASPDVNLDDGLTLDEALELALARNPRLLAVRRELDLGRAQRITAGQWPNNPVLQTGADRALPFSGSEDYNARFGVSQEFELGGKRERRIDVAEANLERGAAEILDEERILRANVAATFYENVMLDELVSLAARSEEIAVRLLEVAQARFDAKQIPEVDLNLVRLQRQRTRDESAQTSSRRRAARQRLAALLGEPSRNDFDVEGDLGAVPQKPGREQSIAAAQAHRPDLAALQARVRMAAAQVRLEQAGVWPDPELGLFYERDALFIDQFSSRDYALGFELSIPIPVLNRRRGEIEEARSELLIFKASLLGLGQQIERDIDLALTRLALAQERVEIYETELNRLSESNVQQLERAYRAGEVGTLEVLRAQDDYNRVTSGYQEALLEHRAARTNLEAVTGTILPLDAAARTRGEE